VRARIAIRSATLNVLEGTPLTVRGALSAKGITPSGAIPPAGGALLAAGPGLAKTLPGRVVTLRMLGRHGWSVVARARTGRRGRFTLRFVPRRLGALRLEVRFGGDAGADAGAAAVRRVLGRLIVYRLAGASWYGGGGGLACGGTLTSWTMGVANKTLPCGTMVTLRYGGRTVRVPVVDRGPYVAGRDFDLTEATKRALGFEGVGQVWSSR
jgi:rare lipoprotein A